MAKTEKKSKSNIFFRIFTNKYLTNILLMALIFVASIFLVLFLMDGYTRHGTSVDVPDLTGLQVEEASAILKSSGLGYEVIDSLFEKKAVGGAILDQVQKPKSKVKKGRVIYLIIQAKGKKMISVPDVEDSSYRQAEALLSAYGLTNVKKETISSEFKDLVFSLEYKGKKLKLGDRVPVDAELVLKVGSGTGESEYMEPIPEIDPSTVIDETFME
ncbi:PASTA domain-containing protein [Dysgonomonas sp. 520]|uniref:PASTA domain-containing protein n=1 Tax=Dysgonomonas sp. 520 TaxID=2302931 RepID=UPI0013D131A9|nr:PASTA domain-containing protein [Dysgonomonas sp. 520]